MAWGNDYPWLDRSIGLICVQHSASNTDSIEIKNDEGKVVDVKPVIPVVTNQISVTGKTWKLVRHRNDIKKGNDDNTGLIAYILSYMNNGSNAYPISSAGRKASGAQGALWLSCTEYFNTFPGRGDPDFAESITPKNETDTPNRYSEWVIQRSQNIYTIGKVYNEMIKTAKGPTVDTGSNFSWKVSGDGNYYIVGPFSATWTDSALNYGVNNNNFTRLAGITTTPLTDGDGNKVEYDFCNSAGNKTGISGTFYIRIHKNAWNGSTGKLRLTINAQYLQVNSEWWDLKYTNYQRRLYVPSTSSYYVPGSDFVEFSPGRIEITKEDADDSNKKLEGVQFKILYENGLYVTGMNGDMVQYGPASQAKVLTTNSSGQLILPRVCDGKYTIIEVGVGEKNWQYEVPKAPNNQTLINVNRNTVRVTIKNKKVFIRITGYAWVDREYQPDKEMVRNDLYRGEGKDVNDRYLQGVAVTLKHKTNSKFDNEKRGTTATTNANGAYQFIVRRSDVGNLYIEFEYDGLEYQTVSPKPTISNGSKAGEPTRDAFNANFATIESDGLNTGYTLNADGNRSQSLTYTRQNHVATLNNVVTTENSTTVQITDAGNYHLKADTTTGGYNFPNNPDGKIDSIDNINLGVYEREEPDLAVVKDIQSVRLSINGKNHVYDYNQRAEATNNEETSGFNVGVKFENDYKTKYRRAIYRADYEYTSDDKSRELQVYITYKIIIKNQSTKVSTIANRIEEYYDSNYELVNVGKDLEEDGSTIKDLITTYQRDESYNNQGFSKLIIEPGLGAIEPQKTKELYVQFHLGREAVIDILNGRENLDNFVEIASYSSVENGKPYAGVDIDSNPGNADPTNEDTVEDDTDISPTLLLEVANAREMEGTVFVDEAEGKNGKNPSEVMTGEIRQGNGIYDIEPNPESTLGNVDITFTEQPEEGNKGVTYTTKTVNETGTYKFKLEYYNSAEEKIEERFERLYIDENELTETNESTDFSSELPAGTKVVVTPTLVDGTEEAEKIYTKELQKGEFFLVGYVPGDYTLTYTWGGQKYELNGEEETVLVQNYKGTVYNTARYQENYVNGNTKWYDVDSITRYTDAMDDYNTRQDIDEDFKTIDYNTDRGKITKMNSTTPLMDIDVEYNIPGTEKIEKDSTEIADRYVNLVPNIDFGVIRRARQDYMIQKRIANIKITLANGRTLADFEIKDDGTLEGTKNSAVYIPPSEETYPRNGLLRFEMDDELMQGASVELAYKLVITNISEVDYTDEEFYNFGTVPKDNEGIVTITPSKIVDYLDNGWEFQAIKNEAYSWKSESTDISKVTDFVLAEEVGESDGYKNSKVLYTDYCADKEEWKLAPIKVEGKYETSNSIPLSVSMILSSSEDIDLENETEIVEIKKTGGSDIEKDIIPGNYPPGLEEQERILISERDDDKAPTFSVTSNTGENRNYVLPITIIITSLMVIIGGVIFIKKKVLNK